MKPRSSGKERRTSHAQSGQHMPFSRALPSTTLNGWIPFGCPATLVVVLLAPLQKVTRAKCAKNLRDLLWARCQVAEEDADENHRHHATSRPWVRWNTHGHGPFAKSKGRFGHKDQPCPYSLLDWSFICCTCQKDQPPK